MISIKPLILSWRGRETESQSRRWKEIEHRAKKTTVIGMSERKDAINPSKNYKGGCRVIVFCKMRQKIIVFDWDCQVGVTQAPLTPKQTCQIMLPSDLVMLFLVYEIMLLRILPPQFCPSPVNPGLQEQMNDPAVFTQVAFFLLQLWVFL